MSENFPAGIEVRGVLGPEFRAILSNEALALVARLQREFGARREQLLARRGARQKEFDQGKLPDFLPDTRSIRESEWKIADQPADMRDRQIGRAHV